MEKVVIDKSVGEVKPWNGKRVLITGHTGFKGAWLTRWMQRMGADVTGFSLGAPVSSPALFDVAGLSTDMLTNVAGDVRAFEELLAAMQQVQPEAVFHLAAQSLVRQGYRDPVGTISTNVMGTVHLLEAVRHTPSVRAVVVCTTDKCYENTSPIPRAFVETDALGGYDPYSSSKASAELVVASYRRSFFSDSSPALIASVRAGNVIGGGDFAEDRLVPDLVRSWIDGRGAAIRYPNAVRPWQHVLEPLSGYLLVAERLLEGDVGASEAWNFGPRKDDARPVRWVVDGFCRTLGGASWREDSGAFPHEAPALMLDSTKVATRLGWTPRWTLETAIVRTAEWYRGWKEGRDPRVLMDADLDEFGSVVQSA